MSENEKIKAALTYLVGFLSGIFFLLIEKKSAFIRFHAMQSTIVFGGIFIASVILGWLPVFGPLLANLLSLLSFGLWLLLVWKAYKGESYELPYVGNLAKQQLKKMASK